MSQAALNSWIAWAEQHWIFLFVAWCILCASAAAVREFFLELARIRSKRIARERKYREKMTAAPAQVHSLPKPGPCVHRQVMAVTSGPDDTVVAWLCQTCKTQLAADWAVREEDL